LLAHVQLGVEHEQQHTLVHGFLPPSDAGLCPSLVDELHEASVSPFLQPAEVHLEGSTTSGASATPPSYVSSADLLRAHSASLFRSSMKVLNRSGPTIDPWGTPLVTGLQLDFPQITTL